MGKRENEKTSTDRACPELVARNTQYALSNRDNPQSTIVNQQSPSFQELVLSEAKERQYPSAKLTAQNAITNNQSVIAEAVAEIEINLESSKEVQKTMETTKEHLDELTRQLEAAKQASDAAQAELDNLQLAEAKAIAELEVIRAEKEKIEEEIAKLTPSVEKLQEEVKQVKDELKSATAKLNEIKEIKEQEQLVAEKARHALQATVSLEAKLIAETEAARKNAERYKRQTQEIGNRLDDLNAKLDEAKEIAKKSEKELRSARITKAKLENELSLYQNKLLSDKLHSQNYIQAQENSGPEISQSAPIRSEKEIVVDDITEKFNNQEEQEDSEKVSTIYNLYDAGYSINDISKATNVAQGQVELFIKMRTLKLSV